MRAICLMNSLRSVRLYRAFGVRCSSSLYEEPGIKISYAKEDHVLTSSVEYESVVPS
jgi:hypothetical protein